MTIDPRHKSHNLLDGPGRAPARAMLKAVGFTDADLERPLIGVANTWIEVMPCNFHLRRLSERVKAGIRAAGGTPIEYNTIAVSDGISMGTEGMKASLISREVIADSIELVARGHLTLDLGTKHSPEFACLPFKITLGSMIEALERGADSIIMPGGWGPCRFGYFDVIQEQILKDLGYSFTMGSAKNPDDLSDMLDLMQRIAGLKSRVGLYKLFFFVLIRLSFLDWVLKKYFHHKPYEAVSGETDQIFEKAIDLIENSLSFPHLFKSVSIISFLFRRMEKRNGINPLRVAMVGELFTLLDPSANMEMDKHLAQKGIEVFKSVWLSDYLNDRFRFKPFRKNQRSFLQDMPNLIFDSIPVERVRNQ